MHNLLAKFFGFNCLLLTFAEIWAGTYIGVANLTLNQYHKLQREKRTLIFEGGNQVKLVVGPTLPVNFADKITFRSLICAHNLQGGHYKVPPEPIYPWDKYESIFERSNRKLSYGQNREKKIELAAAEQYWSDDSRLFVYSVLEKLLDKRKNIDGHNCLLRLICENAQIQQHAGIFAELLNVVLTPGKEKIDASYGEAYEAGKFGANCLELFKDCPMGSNILDAYLLHL